MVSFEWLSVLGNLPKLPINNQYLRPIDLKPYQMIVYRIAAQTNIPRNSYSPLKPFLPECVAISTAFQSLGLFFQSVYPVYLPDLHNRW